MEIDKSMQGDYHWSEEATLCHDELQWVLAYDPKDDSQFNRTPPLKVNSRDK
eukprot:UN24265